MAYGTGKKKSAVKKPAPKKSNPLYYKDKSGTVRFSSTKKPVATGRADQPLFDPIDAVGFAGSLAKNSPKLFGSFINLSKNVTKSAIRNKAAAKTFAGIVPSMLSGDTSSSNKKSNKKSKKSK